MKERITLKDLLLKKVPKEYTLERIAEEIGVHNQSINDYSAGLSLPSVDIAKKLAQMGHYSVDEIIFFDGDDYKGNKKKGKRKISDLIENSLFSKNKIAVFCGVSETRIRQFMSTNKKPSIKLAKKLSEYFKMRTEDIIFFEGDEEIESEIR